MLLTLASLLLTAQDDPLAGHLVRVESARVQFRDSPRVEAPRRKGYVLRGDVLIADGEQGGFTSVTFVPAKGRSSRGWIETAALRRLPASVPKPADWTGAWHQEDADIDIKPAARRGALHAEGLALWGNHDPQRVRNGGIHTGDFTGDAVPAGDRLTYTNTEPGGGCEVRMRLLGPYLLVADNDQCGGMNVTFSGLYRRSKG